MLMLSQFAAILLVLGLLIGTLALLRRKGLAHFPTGAVRRGGYPREMQVVEKIGLSPQHSLHLVNVRDEVFLIGISPSGCNRIASFDASVTGIEPQRQDR